jgi:hypothetical protein
MIDDIQEHIPCSQTQLLHLLCVVNVALNRVLDNLKLVFPTSVVEGRWEQGNVVCGAWKMLHAQQRCR